jgi:hypothetical protein
VKTTTIRSAVSAFFGLCLTIGVATASAGQGTRPPIANRAVYVDQQGVVRWKDDRSEVRLFGANYILPSASDYRAAGYLGLDRKRMIDDDMAHFARMGWDALRLTLWGDWENSDHAGNLIVNDHLDLFDYLIARARERGVYMLLSPIQTYSANWPDALSDTSPPGFSNHFSRGDLGTKPEAIAAQANYLRQLLNHVNPYTGVAIKNEPAILFVELVNEPWHHPDDREGSVRYINTLVDAVRSTGCDKLIFYNLTQDFRIADAIRASKVQGVTIGWYPSALNSGHELEGNFLRSVDAYTPMQTAPLGSLARIVYEFDSADLRTGYMYPAMARAFRGAGAQFATMFAYDMLGTASRNLGWQTHYLNLVYTPRKAMSAIIAAEAMRRLPRLQSYGGYPENTRFGDFQVSYEQNLGVLASDDAFLYTGSTEIRPPHPEKLHHVAGVGSSPVVQYQGTGVYFLDKIRDSVWRLEVYPDAVPVRDPFGPPNRDVVVTRAISRSWPMRITLQDLGSTFAVQAIGGGDLEDSQQRAVDGSVQILPGVYLIGASSKFDRRSLPRYVGALSLEEFHRPPLDTMAVQVVDESTPVQSTARPVQFVARVVDSETPKDVRLVLRGVGAGFFRWFRMQPAKGGGYDFRLTIPAESLPPGRYEYGVVVTKGETATTFPAAIHGRPGDWNFRGDVYWPLTVVTPSTAVRLFDPLADAPHIAFTRIGDAGRRGIFRTVTSPQTGTPAFHFELPVFNGHGLRDYTASLVINDRVSGRRGELAGARALRIRLRGLGPSQQLHVTLMEEDGTSWTAAVTTDSAWSERVIPLDSLHVGRAVLLPQGFPGDWNYWVGPATGRGRGRETPNDRIRISSIERLQLSLRDEGRTLAPGQYGVEIESILLTFQ